MTRFHSLTLDAATRVIRKLIRTHDELDAMIFAWGCGEAISDSTVSHKLLDLANLAHSSNPEVRTVRGQMPLGMALIEQAMSAPEHFRNGSTWTEFIAALRMDGFEVATDPDHFGGGFSVQGDRLILRRMLPQDVPEVDFREADSELDYLLDRCGLEIAKGHLTQARSAFSRGEWASANAQLRSFLEGYLNEIADRLGCLETETSVNKRRFLGQLDPPFLLSDYNEWHDNQAKPQFVQGLMSRLHPAGSHPGLSEEDDCTFRMQISLMTARLLLRRYDQRVAS